MTANRMEAVEGEFVAPQALNEKRQALRRSVVLPVEAMLVDSSVRPVVPIKAQDLTGRGMGFTSPHGFRVGDRVAVRLRLRTGQCDLVLGRVRHCAAAGRGLYRGGIEFLAVSRLAGEEMVLPKEWVAATS